MFKLTYSYSSLAGFTLTFEHEQLELIQLESNDIEPQDPANSVGILYPAQRMDFIIRSSKVEGRHSSSMTVELDPE
mgnify:CR=1 FL=1